MSKSRIISFTRQTQCCHLLLLLFVISKLFKPANALSFSLSFHLQAVNLLYLPAGRLIHGRVSPSLCLLASYTLCVELCLCFYEIKEELTPVSALLTLHCAHPSHVYALILHRHTHIHNYPSITLDKAVNLLNFLCPDLLTCWDPTVRSHEEIQYIYSV